MSNNLQGSKNPLTLKTRAGNPVATLEPSRLPSRTRARVPRRRIAFLSGDAAATIRAVPDGHKDRLALTVTSVRQSPLCRNRPWQRRVVEPDLLWSQASRCRRP